MFQVYMLVVGTIPQNFTFDTRTLDILVKLIKTMSACFVGGLVQNASSD